MANVNLEVNVKIDPSIVEIVSLIRAANDLLCFREGIIAKEYDKFSPTLCGALHDLAMAVEAAEHRVQSTLLTDLRNHCVPVNGVHAPFCTGHESQSA